MHTAWRIISLIFSIGLTLKGLRRRATCDIGVRQHKCCINHTIVYTNKYSCLSFKALKDFLYTGRFIHIVVSPSFFRKRGGLQKLSDAPLNQCSECGCEALRKQQGIGESRSS
ncbi:hypothetical protein GJV44_00796 [Candidatus Vallotia cooleyia]|nr:hypothetical protein GJV44_00796 [Candidatus Vallotia cooleyia]